MRLSTGLSTGLSISSPSPPCPAGFGDCALADQTPPLVPEPKAAMSPDAVPPTLVNDEIDVLSDLVPLAGQQVIELGCGAAALARTLLARHPDSRVTGLEVDAHQHAKNLTAPQTGLSFVAAGAQAIPFPEASFDLALMLKSLHHVPLPLLAQALGEAARVLRPGGHLYVSEPVYAGPFNDVIRFFNDEGVVRAAAQAAVDAALQQGPWKQVAELRFGMPVYFRDFDDFERRMMRPSFADHCLDDAKLAATRQAFAPQMGPTGAHFVRLMHVRLLRRID
jgi:SAM-dependent methyltransferase